MSIIKLLQKNRITHISDDQKPICEKLSKLNQEVNLLKKNKIKIYNSYLKIKKKIKLIEDQVSNLNNKIDFDKIVVKPKISIGFDKRSYTYNCIYDRGKNKHCFYLGNESTIKSKLKPFHTSDICKQSFKSIKSQLIDVIEIGINQYEKEKPNCDLKEINFNLIVRKYIESAKWDTWRVV